MLTGATVAEPMSDERLAEAQRNHAAYKASHAPAGSFACCSAHASADDVPELLAEVERLRGALAEFGKTDTEWSVLHISGRDGPLCEADARRFAKHAAAAGARLQSRVVGEWREAD